MEMQTYRFKWQGIEIEAVYEPERSDRLAHLEIRSIAPEDAPLPITGTGHCSNFHLPGTAEGRGGDVAAQVIAWLDEEAAKPHWQSHIEASRQGCLF